MPIFYYFYWEETVWRSRSATWISINVRNIKSEKDGEMNWKRRIENFGKIPKIYGYIFYPTMSQKSSPLTFNDPENGQKSPSCRSCESNFSKNNDHKKWVRFVYNGMPQDRNSKFKFKPRTTCGQNLVVVTHATYSLYDNFLAVHGPLKAKILHLQNFVEILS